MGALNTNIDWEHLYIYTSIYGSIYRSEGLSLRDMLSLGAWRMVLGCSGKKIRRRRRRRPRLILFRQILGKSRHFQLLLMKIAFWDFFI